MLNKILKPFNGHTLKVYAAAVIGSLCAGMIFLGVNTAVGITTEAPRITVGDGNHGVVVVVPAIGEEGYPVAAFCGDAATTVRVSEVPGSPGHGLVYELVRVKDNVPEMITWATGIDNDNNIATFYYVENGMQQSAVAVVDDAAADCIREKAGG